MELMSSLLLCAVVAFSPQTFGKPNMEFTEYGALKSNSSMDMPTQRNILMYINRPPLIRKRNAFQSTFTDLSCKHCNHCIDRAEKSLKAHPKTEEYQEEIMSSFNEVVTRDKRQIDPTNVTKVEEPVTKAKKSKSKKNKVSKSVTVTKYNVDGEITALKVKETNTQVAELLNDFSASTTCQVYTVRKSYPCDSPESDLILADARRKMNKKNKKDKTKVGTTTEIPKSTSPAFRKREVDNSQVPENFMPSIEELY